jgi:ribosome-binding protein aMBF1 (putative translation factor)
MPTRGELAYALKAAVCVLRAGNDATGLMPIVDETLQQSYAEGLVPRNLPIDADLEGRTRVSLTVWHYAAGLKRARQRAGMSARKLGLAAGLSPSYVSYLESARRRPSVDALESLAFAMGIPLSVLIKDCEEASVG